MRFLLLVAAGDREHPLGLAKPVRQTTVPRTIWSACFGSTPRRSASSTVSSNFANFTFCISGNRILDRVRTLGNGCRAAANFLPDFALCCLGGADGRRGRPPTSTSCQLSAVSYQFLAVDTAGHLLRAARLQLRADG